jgi:hypothetical protein
MAKEKNLGKLKSRFEVRGGIINEFNFHQNQGAMTEEDRDRFARQEEETALREGEGAQQPQTEAERIEQLMAASHEKAEKNLRKKEKQSGAKKSAGKKGAGKKSAVGAKKSTGKKAAAKKTTKPGKGPAKKSGGKSAAGKGGGKKSATKKSAAKKQGGRGR